MAVIGVPIEDWRDRGVHGEAEKLHTVRIWTVQFDDADDAVNRPVLAYYATGIPRIYARHPFNRWLYVKSKDVETLGPSLYKVIVNYEGETQSTSRRGGRPISPLAMPAEESWFFATSNEQIDRDINGVAITNSAGESFDPPITREFHDLVWRVIVNRPIFNSLLASQYVGSVNSDKFQGFLAGKVLCKVFTANKIFTPYLIYFRTTFEFQLRWDGWKRKILDQGFRKKTGVDGAGKPTYEQFLDDEGTVLSEPVLLNGAGDKLNDVDDAEKREFDIRRQLPFAVLGLG